MDSEVGTRRTAADATALRSKILRFDLDRRDHDLEEPVVSKGLTFRPVSDTVLATLAWFRKQPPERQANLRCGLSPEREAPWWVSH